jgi:hypothetical protein
MYTLLCCVVDLPAQGLVRSEAQDVRRRMAEIRQRMAVSAVDCIAVCNTAVQKLPHHDATPCDDIDISAMMFLQSQSNMGADSPDGVWQAQGIGGAGDGSAPGEPTSPSSSASQQPRQMSTRSNPL